MIHPHTELRPVSAKMGCGVFATSAIPAGTIVYVEDEMELVYPLGHPMIDHPLYGPIIDKYSFIDAAGNRIVSWDIAKFVNHSCDPNTMSTGFGFEIAVRDIAVGEEITDEYGMFNLPMPMPCQCGVTDCRGLIQGDDLLTFAPEWDHKVKGALKKLAAVDQPLADFLDETTREALETLSQTGRGYLSVKALYHYKTAVDQQNRQDRWTDASIEQSS